MRTRKDFPEDSKRVGIWVRVSTEDQVKGESPEHHERRARLYAESKGWEVVELYRLDALSGKTVKDYPETKRMLADIKSGHITGLIFSKLALLARNTKELLDFAEIFRDYDADLISLAESIDTSTPAGRLFYTMIAAMAQWEREEISARIAASVPIRAKMGKSLGGQAHFGYQWKDGKLILDPTEAPIRKLMYELFREHGRKKTVARILNERGYRTRNGSQFSDTTITRLLHDPTAKGIRRANYTKSKDSTKTWELKPESEWVLHEIDAIISEDLWNEVNAILDSQQRGKRPARQVTHLFAGLTYCGCGQKMYVPSNTSKYTCRHCRNKIPIVDLEGVFHEQIKNFFFSTDEIAAHLSLANAAIHEKEELLGVLLKERKKLTDEVDKLYELYQGNAIDKAGFGVKYHPLAERGRQLEDEIPQVQAELDVLKISHLSQEEIITGARDLYTRWPELPREEKRRIVEAITDRIVIYDGEVEINLFYAPPTSTPPVGTPFNPQTPGTSTPPPPSPLSGGKMATKLQGCGLPETSTRLNAASSTIPKNQSSPGCGAGSLTCDSKSSAPSSCSANTIFIVHCSSLSSARSTLARADASR
ncbi:MAG: recombinase family protein [Gallionellaceae bacterium]